MKITVEIPDELLSEIEAAVQSDTGLKLEDAISDWLRQTAKRAAIHIAENAASSEAAQAFDAAHNGKIKAERG